jgi:hypothetical protein
LKAFPKDIVVFAKMESEEILKNMSGTEETKEEQMMEGIVLVW